MTEKSIPEQIIEDFIGKLSKNSIFSKERLKILKRVLNSNNPKKQDILNAITKNDYNENT